MYVYTKKPKKKYNTFPSNASLANQTQMKDVFQQAVCWFLGCSAAFENVSHCQTLHRC